MGKFRKTDRLGVGDQERRDFLKFMVLTGSMMGVKPWKVFEVMEDTIGTAHAQSAASSTIAKSIHINAGTGALSRFYLLWPHIEVARETQNIGAAITSTSIAMHRTAVQQAVNTRKPLYFVEDTPWKDLPGGRQVTALMGGFNIVHDEVAITNTRFPTGGAGTTRGEASVFAAAAVLQKESATAIPVMTVDSIAGGGQAQPFGAADGSGSIPVARARNFPGLIDMVASEAAKPGRVIAKPENAALYARYYEAVKRLNKANGNYSYQTAYKSADQALSVMVKQLATELTPTDEDVDRYLGLTNPVILNALGNQATAAARVAVVDARASSDTDRRGSKQLSDFARTLILSARAYARGVTNMVMMPAFNDDPHGLFNDLVACQNQTFMTGNALNEFMRDCSTALDPGSASGSTVGQNLVVHIYGDCTKNALDKGGWPDNPQRNSNCSFILGQGWLKSGWYGGVTRTGGVLRANGSGSEGEVMDMYNPHDPNAPFFRINNQNDPQNQTSARLGEAVAGALLYAICNGQVTKWRQFYSGDAIPGLINIDRA